MMVSRRWRATVAAAVCVAIACCHIRTPPSAADRHAENEASSAAYLGALKIADAFLWAWVTRDAEGGVQFLSARLRAEATDEAWLRQFIAGLSNPHHQAFILAGGVRQAGDRYAFAVTLYELYTGENRGSAYTSTLEVVREGQVWRIDRLPRSSDNP